MLDSSVVMLCTEVCDGNTNLHDNMPFIVAGRAGGRISSGQLVQGNSTRHGALLAAIAQSMGANVQGCGDGNPGPRGGVLS